jgi:aminoglycoside phosphotransferase (APT) family kinase protein
LVDRAAGDQAKLGSAASDGRMTEAVVRTPAEAERLEFGAAIVLEPLEAFLDEAGLGSEELDVETIGDGHSNLSFLLRRGDDRFVLRRPPRGELSASANDVLRESRVLEALGRTDVPVPVVLARCEDPTLLGSPFFVMSLVPGSPITAGQAGRIAASPSVPAKIATEMVSTLGRIHSADLRASGLDSFGKPSGYLERQLRRFGSLLEANATRPLDDLETVTDWLSENRPTSSESAFVHGDYRLGNLMFGSRFQLESVLDWEMATVGDPLADLGYCTAMWAAPDDPETPLSALSPITRSHGFPGRDQVADEYARVTGRSIAALPWYQVFALWKSAIFLEGSFRRFKAGASSDSYFAQLDSGVPAIARVALEWSGRC